VNSAPGALALLLLSLAVAQPALADERRGKDKWEKWDKGEKDGPRTKFESNNVHYKYEYRDRNCRYKYEFNFRSGKTKIEEKGDCRGIVLVRPVMRGEPLPRAIPPEPHARRIACNREVLGTIIGGAIGAGVGARVGERRDRVITTVGGAVIGAVIGGAIGRSMDEADHACASQALEYASLNQAVAWDNAARGTSYVVTPVEIDQSDKNAECRKYVVRTVSGGQQQETAGRACRRADGSWAPAG
jgi:surface antigen